jgi:hypothetical protein
VTPAATSPHVALDHSARAPLVSSGPMPPQNTGKRISRICLTSAHEPFGHAARPRRAHTLAVESSSPQGAMRSVGAVARKAPRRRPAQGRRRARSPPRRGSRASREAHTPACTRRCARAR